MCVKDMYYALCDHTKIVTRRTPGAVWLRAHMRAFHSKQAVRVWSRPDSGSLYGKLAGHVFYTHVCQQRLDAMTRVDVMLEGFPAWTVAQFHAAKFPGVPTSTNAYVFFFTYFPL